MKKIISVLTLFALASTMFTVSAFAEEKPTLNYEVTPYTDYDELVGHNDYLEEAEEIPEGYTAYVIDFYLTNLDLSNSGSQTSPTGTVITDFALYLKTSAAELELIDSAVTYANYSADPDGKGYEWSSYYYTSTLSRTKGVFPKKTQDGGDVFASTVVMIPSDKSVSLTPMKDVFNNGNVTFTTSVNIATFSGGTLTSGSQAGYNLASNTLAFNGDKIVLGTPTSDDKIEAVEDDTTGALVMDYGTAVDAADKKLAGKYIVFKNAVVAANTLTENTRVRVTYDDPASDTLDNSVVYGNSIYEYLGITGEGQTYAKSLAFGIVYEDSSYKADYFTFEVFEQE